MMVSRLYEKRLMMIAGVWEVVWGLFTVLFYATYYKREGLAMTGLTMIEAEAVDSVFGSLYMFIVSFGMLFVIIGITNLFLATKMRDHHVEYKIPVFVLGVGILSYLAMDLIGGILCLAAGVLALSKNKVIRLGPF